MVLGVTGGVASIALCRYWINQAARGRVFDDAARIPHRRVALVLGCCRVLPNGRGNLFFKYRMQAAAELYHAGKADYLLVSGDNHRQDYNEPAEMRQCLIDAGVPAERVFCDYAGFRTLDSVVRAQEVFGEQQITVVSQAFHVNRAIYIGTQRDMDVIGLAARDVARSSGGQRTRLREMLARVKTVLDVQVLRTKPKFLGPKIAIETAEETLIHDVHHDG